MSSICRQARTVLPAPARSRLKKTPDQEDRAG
jgi:hypothetical protein